MANAEKLFHQIAGQLPNGKTSKVFGALCIKATNGKSAVIFWKDEMMFKLSDEDVKKTLMLKGARQGSHLYAPDKQMKGWVVLPFTHSSTWLGLSRKSIKYVSHLK